MNDEANAKRAADQRTIAMLIIIVVIAHAMLALMALVLPQMLGVVLVLGGFVWFAVMHYVIWGWWLGGYLRRMSEKSGADNGESVTATPRRSDS